MEPYKRLSSLLNHPRVRTSIIGPLINCVLYYARLVAPHLCTYFMFKMKYLINLRVRLVLVFFLMGGSLVLSLLVCVAELRAVLGSIHLVKLVLKILEF